MPKFLRRGSLCGGVLAGLFGLLSSCGDTSSDTSPKPGPDDGGAAGEPAATGGKSGGSAGHAGSSQGGTATNQAGTTNQAGAPLGEAGSSAGAGTDGGSPGEAGSASVAGAGGGTGEAAGAGGEGTMPASCTDLDGDGYGDGDGCAAGPDCNDDNPLVNPGMLELADDGKDNDCAGGDLKAATGPGYYVNGSDPGCSDAPGALGTKAAPYCSIEMAVVYAYQATAADDATGRSLFVAQGTYPLTVGSPRSVRIYGGYDAADWSYDPAKNVTVIGGSDVLQDVDGFKGWSSWLNVNGKARAVVQGFHIQGGQKPGAPIFAVELNTSGKVELYDNVITAGAGYQTLAVSIVGETKTDPSTSNVWLLNNRISAGTPSDSSNYGVNNLGTAVLWGNQIDMGQGSGKPASFGAAVQNYGAMILVNNVLNGGNFGAAVDASYGFINATANSLPLPGRALVYDNVIFGGRGGVTSVGVSNNAKLTLFNNVLGDRTPGPLALAQKPTSVATALSVGFANTTWVASNDLQQLIYSDEVNPPDAGANRHLFLYADNTAHVVDDLTTLNDCAWTGCSGGSGKNLAVDPGFVGASDFHLAPGSLLLGQGAGLLLAGAHGLWALDVDGQPRPSSQCDIGIDER
jgi:hypothetical protein